MSSGRFLPYAFVGTGFGSQTIDRTVLGISGFGAFQLGRATSKSNIGLRIHAPALGFDVMVTGGLFLRAECEYSPCHVGLSTSNINTVRAGLGYKF